MSQSTHSILNVNARNNGPDVGIETRAKSILISPSEDFFCLSLCGKSHYNLSKNACYLPFKKKPYMFLCISAIISRVQWILKHGNHENIRNFPVTVSAVPFKNQHSISIFF